MSTSLVNFTGGHVKTTYFFKEIIHEIYIWIYIIISLKPKSFLK